MRQEHLESDFIHDWNSAPRQLRAATDDARSVRGDDDCRHRAAATVFSARCGDEPARRASDRPDRRNATRRARSGGDDRSRTIALDVRDTWAFGAAHIPRSVNIGLDGQYASSCLFSPRERFVIVADGEETSREAVMRLARVGIENVDGFIDRGILGWTAAGKTTQDLPQIDVAGLHDNIRDFDVVDVRRPAEYAGGHVPGARNLPLADFVTTPAISSRPVGLICASGYRSSIAANLLARAGANATNVTGGTSAWVRAGYETETA
jgi:rhodanese-related sulfurtransferase